MELVLHIGHEKTGTSSIQRSLTLSANYLKTLGISISDFPGNGNDWVIPAMFSKTTDTYDLHGIKEGIQSTLKENHKSQFEKYIKNLHPKTKLILTSEHFASRLTSVEEVSELAMLLTKYFEKVTILIFLRNQACLQQAAHWEELKSGFSNEITFRPNNKTISSSYFNYKLLLEPWDMAFGKENINVFGYDYELEEHEDIVDCFFLALPAIFNVKIDISKIIKSARINSTPSNTVMELLRQFNHEQINENPRFSSRPYLIDRPARRDLINAIENLTPGGPKINVDRRAWHEKFKDTNKHIEDRYLVNGKIFPKSKKVNNDNVFAIDHLTQEKIKETVDLLFSLYVKNSKNRKENYSSRLLRRFKVKVQKILFIWRYTKPVYSTYPLIMRLINFIPRLK